MAIVKRCDRCGKIYENAEKTLDIVIAEMVENLSRNNALLDRALDGVTERVDLCTSCERDFINWWQRRGKYGA